MKWCGFELFRTNSRKNLDICWKEQRRQEKYLIIQYNQQNSPFLACKMYHNIPVYTNNLPEDESVVSKHAEGIKN